MGEKHHITRSPPPPPLCPPFPYAVVTYYSGLMVVLGGKLVSFTQLLGSVNSTGHTGCSFDRFAVPIFFPAHTINTNHGVADESDSLGGHTVTSAWVSQSAAKYVSQVGIHFYVRYFLANGKEATETTAKLDCYENVQHFQVFWFLSFRARH